MVMDKLHVQNIYLLHNLNSSSTVHDNLTDVKLIIMLEKLGQFIFHAYLMVIK